MVTSMDQLDVASDTITTVSEYLREIVTPDG